MRDGYCYNETTVVLAGGFIDSNYARGGSPAIYFVCTVHSTALAPFGARRYLI
jgi:hypothetical protein